jgi:hypothetical protein
MSSQFASGKHAIAVCDVCGFQYKLNTLRKLVVKGVVINVLACRTCWDKDHPQLFLGTFPINDPQALRNPRRDTTYSVSGLLADGEPGEGSRTIQWGWAPVGGARAYDAQLSENDLVLTIDVGDVTVTTT